MTTVRVLVVEDNEADQEWIRRSLAASNFRNFEPSFARSLDEATTQLHTKPFDGVFLDLGLPDSHALFTVTHIRSNFPNIPIVVLSGTDDESITLAAMRSGAQEYLVKTPETRHFIGRALVCAIERNRSVATLRMNLFRDPDTQFLAEPAFRMMVETYLESAESRKFRPMLLIAGLENSWNKQAQFTSLLVDQVATALTRTFPQEQIFGRLRGDLFAVLIKDGRKIAKASVLEQFQQNLLEVQASGGSPPLRVSAQLMACRDAVPRKLEAILSDPAPKSNYQTA